MSFPPEIIFQIIESLIPDPKPIALPSSHPVTQTLLSLTQTCRLIYPTSMRLLYSYCIYVDSFIRLYAFEEALLHLGRHALENSTHLNIPLLKHITSMYIGPFPLYQIYVEDIHHIESICRLLLLVAPTLTRLIISLRRPHPEADFFIEGEFELVSETLDQLTSLEVFYNNDDALWRRASRERRHWEAFMSWIHWPKLQVLALIRNELPYDYDLGSVSESAQLRTLVLRYQPNNELLDNEYRRRWWRVHGEGTGRKINLFLVYEKRHGKDMSQRGGEEMREHEDSMNTVRIDLTYVEDLLQRNRVYRERVVEQILNWYETF